MDAEKLKEILYMHGKYCRGEVGGQLADLRYADLSYADLSYANLRSANLRSAKFLDTANITGEPWSDYLSRVVPSLLTAGGKSLAEVVESGCWECHSWENCPMAVAFGVHSVNDTPLLLRPRVEQFVQLFDAKLIPQPAAGARVAGKLSSRRATTMKRFLSFEFGFAVCLVGLVVVVAWAVVNWPWGGR